MNRRAWVALGFALLAAPACLDATTIIPFSDSALTDQAPIILLGRVVGKLPNTTDRAVTDWLINVEKTLKGEVPAGSITVRVLGGQVPSGEVLKIFGAPSFEKDEDVLLFLTQRPGSPTYEVFQFLQGAFHKARQGDKAVAVQDLSEVRTISKRTGRVRNMSKVRDFDGFVRWIQDREEGTLRRPNYLLKPSSQQMLSMKQRFTLAVPNIRWFDFDTGGSVSWRNNGSLAGLSSGGSSQFLRAMALWTNEPTTPVKLVHGGSSTSTTCLCEPDGQNVLLFGDPEHVIEDINCSTGAGTFSAAGAWFVEGGEQFNQKTYGRIIEGDIVVNNGVDCLFPRLTNPSKWVERTLASDLGHTLGIWHSSENPNEPNPELSTALMYYRIAPTDVRGASFNSDDLAALRTLYKKSGAGGGGGGTPPPGGCPAGTPVNTLCLLKGRFRVTGTWDNQFNGSQGTAIPITNTDLSGFFYFTDRSNVELIIKILDFGSEIKVFYSQLTNLNFSLTVTDTATGKTKNYTNTPGNCGAIDANFNASAMSSDAEGVLASPLPATASCTATTDTLCLLDRRFAVNVSWRNQFNGASGLGRQKTLSNLTGAFSFDDPANLEILIKTLDFGDHVLVLYGSLSNFEYTIRVTDTTTGAFKDYRNAAGQYCGGLDQNAF